MNITENRSLFLKLHFDRSDELKCKETQVNWNIDGQNHRFDLGQSYLPLTLVINNSGLLNIKSGMNNYELSGNSALLLSGGNKYQIKHRNSCSTDAAFVFFGGNYVRDYVHSIYEDQLSNQKLGLRFIETVIRNNPLYGKIHSDFICNYLKYRFERISMKDKADLLLAEIVRNDMRLQNKINELNFVKRSTRIELFKRLEMAVDYIESVFPAPMSLDEIAKHAALSKYHLIRAFRMVFKCTPFGYISGLKARKAKELLQNENVSITEISELLGFMSVHSFSAFFSKAFGISPTHFRTNQFGYRKKAI